MTGRVFPGEATADAYAQYILDTLGEPGAYLRYAEAARDDFDVRLNWKAGARRLADLLGKVI